MPRATLPRPLEALALPGRYLVGKIAELKKQQLEQSRRKVTERELAHLNHKIDKLLVRLEEHEPEPAQSQDEECAICISAKATMQTFPCGHRVVCRKCFVKTIQMAVSQRMLPLRCVICRAKILRLKQSSSSSGSHDQATEFISRGMAFRDPATGVPTKINLYVNHSKDPALLISEHVRRATPPPRLSFHRPGRLTRPLLPIPETEELEIVHSVRSVTPSLCAENGDLWSPQDNLKLGAPAKADMQAKRWSPLARLRRLRSPSLFKGIRNKCK